MLPKKYRISKRDIPNVVRKGKKFSTNYFDVKVWYDDEIKENKFGFIISKKVSKSAVKRNRIKRKLRSSIHKLVKENLFKKGKYVFIVRNSELDNFTSQEILEKVKEIF